MRSLIVGMALVSLLGGVRAEEREVTWETLRQEVAQRHLQGRTVTVSLASGASVTSALRRIEPDSLVVRAGPNTEKRWRASGGEAVIPRADVTALRFAGRQGHRGLIAGLIGLGAGAGMAAAWAKGTAGTIEGPAAGAGLVLIPVCALPAYLIGRHYDRPIPRFRIVGAGFSRPQPPRDLSPAGRSGTG